MDEKPYTLLNHTAYIVIVYETVTTTAESSLVKFGASSVSKHISVMTWIYILCFPLHVQEKSRVSDLCTGDATVRIFCEQAVEIAIPLCCWTNFSGLLPWRCVCTSLPFSIDWLLALELRRKMYLQAQRATL